MASADPSATPARPSRTVCLSHEDAVSEKVNFARSRRGKTANARDRPARVQCPHEDDLRTAPIDSRGVLLLLTSFLWLRVRRRVQLRRAGPRAEGATVE
jgi:hypothetical protein